MNNWPGLVFWALTTAVVMMALAFLAMTIADAYKDKRVSDCMKRGVDRATCEQVLK